MPPLPESSNDDSILNIYKAHGIYPSPSTGKEATTDCPFCGREEKFYINRTSGLFYCQICNAKGNPIEFLRQLHKLAEDGTTEERYQELARERKYLGIQELQSIGFAYNNHRNEWVIPGYSEDDSKLKQLYHWTDYKAKDGKKHLQSTPTFNQCLYGVREFDKTKPDVWLCEGPWDMVALAEILKITKINDEFKFETTGNIDVSLFNNINLIAIPSTTSPIENWLHLLSGKRVYLLLDNDHPYRGKDVNGKESIREPAAWGAYKRIVSKIIENNIKPLGLQYLHWGKNNKEHSYNPNLKHGYDVRDLLSEGFEKPIFNCTKVDERIEALQKRMDNLATLYNYFDAVPPQWIDPTNKPTDKPASKQKEICLNLAPCMSWSELVKQGEKAIIWHDGVDKALSSMVACIASVLIPGTQVWLRLISEPSSGKTILCDAVCVNQNYVSMQCNIRGFFSGMRPTKKQAKEGMIDLGLLAEINGKAFVTKDADPILQSVDRPRIMAEARDLFDGKTNTHFRTGMGKKFPMIRTVWIMCGTSRVRDIDENDLGGRFIDCTLLRGITPKLKSDITRSAIRSMFNQMNKRVNFNDLESLDNPEMLMFKKMTGGYIEHICKNGERLMEQIQENTVKEGYENFEMTIEAIAHFVAKMRTRPGKKDEFIIEELPARLGEQFTRFAMCLALVLNEPYVTRKVLRRVAELAFDTAAGSVYKMTKYLYDNPKGGSQETLWKVVMRKAPDFKELLRFLVRLNAFTNDRYDMSSMDGYGDGTYTLSTELRGICDRVFPYMEHVI